MKATFHIDKTSNNPLIQFFLPFIYFNKKNEFSDLHCIKLTL
jgi:hypothetical protein